MKRVLTIIVLLMCMASMQAQERTFWQKVNHFLTKPAVVDTARIYQPKAGFSLGLFTTGQKAGFNVDVNFKADLGDEPLTGLSQYSLRENLCNKIGLEVGYGNVGFGYGLEVGPKSAWKKSAFAFNIVGKSWGVHLNYYKITNPFTSSLTLGEEGDENYQYDEFTSEEPAVLKSLSVDGYYVFNNKRFAYPAAYKIGLVQRHTAGSWLLTARYMQGSLFNYPDITLSNYTTLDCYYTLQASVGGGYSANFVLWHKDPQGPRDQGLRNITINLTAMPVITFVNYLKTSSYTYELNEETMEVGYSGEEVSKIWCYPMPNYIGSAAFSMTFGRIFFSSQFTYNWFYFRSNNAFNASQVDIPSYVDGLTIKGSFRDWMLKGILVYRF